MKRRSVFAIPFAALVLLAACGGSDDSESSELGAASAVTAPELTQLEQDYLFQIGAAWDLFGTKAASFRGVFAQAWPTRERLFTALSDAGVGTAWVDSLEATEKLEVPRRFHDDHEILLAGLAEAIRIDAEIGETLKDGDLVEFVVLNSELGVSRGLLFSALSPLVCQALTREENPNASCRSDQPLHGGEYGLNLEQIMLRFDAQIGPRLSIWGETFIALASDEEFLSALDQAFSALQSMSGATLRELSQQEPPEDLSADHEILVKYVTDQQNRIVDAIGLIRTGNREGFEQTAVLGLLRGRCGATRLLSAGALSIAHGHFPVGFPCSEIFRVF